MTTIKKNGKAYDGGDVQITLLGSTESEVSEIEYNHNQEHQRNYYLGSNDAMSWSRGKKEYTASITLSMRTIVALEDAVGGNKRLEDIKPFDVVVSYVNEFSKIVTDVVTCKFMGQGRAVTGEMGMGQKFDLFVLDIKYNIV